IPRLTMRSRTRLPSRTSMGVVIGADTPLNVSQLNSMPAVFGTVLPSNTVPNTAGMEFNWLTFNGVSAPMTTPMLVRLGSRVRLRIVNLGMDHHPVHLHGNQFVVTGTEGGRAPESTWY